MSRRRTMRGAPSPRSRSKSRRSTRCAETTGHWSSFGRSSLRSMSNSLCGSAALAVGQWASADRHEHWRRGLRRMRWLRAHETGCLHLVTGAGRGHRAGAAEASAGEGGILGLAGPLHAPPGGREFSPLLCNLECESPVCSRCAVPSGTVVLCMHMWCVSIGEARNSPVRTGRGLGVPARIGFCSTSREIPWISVAHRRSRSC